ncbi:MAG TPA: hypothetical protein VEF33_11030 [Syntrophales bacterium]|nr:hypothetical protein [Syntrophales bacterium]
MHHSYIVRLYRYDKDNPRMIVGAVEKVGAQGRLSFTNIDELWEILVWQPRRGSSADDWHTEPVK